MMGTLADLSNDMVLDYQILNKRYKLEDFFITCDVKQYINWSISIIVSPESGDGLW